MVWNISIFDKVTIPVGWENIDNGNQFFYQPDLLCGVEPNDGIRDNNDENMDGEGTNM